MNTWRDRVKPFSLILLSELERPGVSLYEFAAVPGYDAANLKRLLRARRPHRKTRGGISTMLEIQG